MSSCEFVKAIGKCQVRKNEWRVSSSKKASGVCRVRKSDGECRARKSELQVTSLKRRVASVESE